MEAFEVKHTAPELVAAIYKLAEAISQSAGGIAMKDPAGISDSEMAALPGGEDPKKYTMFNDMAAAAKKLQSADAKAYGKVLRKFVEPDKKYSAIEAKDWSKATKEFKKALAELSKADDEDEEETSDGIATEVMYYFHADSDCVGIIKKGEEIPDDPDFEWLTKGEYVKKKKDIEAREAEAESEDEDSYSDDEAEAPRLSNKELKALAAKAANAGVAVGTLMKKIAGVTKISSFPEDKYNELEDKLREAMEE